MYTSDTVPATNPLHDTLSQMPLKRTLPFLLPEPKAAVAILIKGDADRSAPSIKPNVVPADDTMREAKDKAGVQKSRAKNSLPQSHAEMIILDCVSDLYRYSEAHIHLRKPHLSLGLLKATASSRQTSFCV